MGSRRVVAITGASGLIGSVLVGALRGRYDIRALTRRDADVADLPALRRAFAGADTVVHLAASAAVDSTWDDVVGPNLFGVRNVYEAALATGVRRVVFASSNHVVGMYQWDDTRFADPEAPAEVAADAPVRPDSLYGATKAWGEALGRYYAERLGLSVVCLRIGWVTEDDEVPAPTAGASGEPDRVRRRGPGMWMSQRDCVDLVAAAIEARVRFAIVHGVGDNRGRWLSLEEGRRLLAWTPRDGTRTDEFGREHSSNRTDRTRGEPVNFNSILIGSESPDRLVDYYTRLLGEPAMSDGGYTGWQLGSGFVTVGPHSEVSGKNAHPGRLIWNIECADVRGEFERLRAAGAIVVREPYGFDDDESMLIATLADPDDNYFQLMSPMEPPPTR